MVAASTTKFLYMDSRVPMWAGTCGTTVSSVFHKALKRWPHLAALPTIECQPPGACAQTVCLGPSMRSGGGRQNFIIRHFSTMV